MNPELELGLSILALCVFIWFLSRAVSRHIRHEEALRLDSAKVFLEKQGYTSHLYLATIGTQDRALREAMDLMAHNGYILLDKEGRMAGKVLPNLQKDNHSSVKLAVDTA